MSRVIVVNTLGPQGPPGPQGPAGSGSIDTGSFATTGSNSFIGNQTISGSLIITGSVLISGSNTFTNIGPTIFSGSVDISGSTTINGNSILTTANTGSLNVLSSSYASTASYVNTLNQDLTFNGNLTLNGTASITYLNTIYETASVIYSSGSNQFGDAPNDTQTLYGSVIIPTGSLTVTGSTIISSSATTQLQVGSNLLFISSSGNVGIGTNAPTQKLHVSSGNAFVNGIIYFGDGSHYLTTDNSTYTMLSSNRNLQLARSGFAALTVFSTLNIGIGTTTDSGAKLYISGSSNSALLQVDSPASSSILFVSGSGRVGIGTNRPAYPFHVQHIGGSGVTGSLVFANQDNSYTGLSVLSNGLGFSLSGHVGGNGYISANNSLNFTSLNATSPTSVWLGNGSRLRVSNTAETETYLTIATNGNVLIGTTTDSGYKLDVSGSSRFTSHMIITGSQIIRHSYGTTYYDSGGYGGGKIYGSYNYANGEILIQPSGSILTSFVFSPNNGMSIGGFTIGGTTGSPPAYGLTVSGSVGIGTRIPSSSFHIVGSSGSALLRVDSDASSSILFISGSGRVGIGTSTPDRPLHISSSGTTGLRIDTTGVGGDAIFISNASALIRWAGGSYVNKQGFYSGTDDQQYITFDGASTQVRLQIKASNGNVGIGTTTDSGFKLDVSGSGRFTNGLTVTGSVTASGNIVASSYLGDPNVQFGLNPSSGANTYIRLENTGLVPNGILFNTNNTSNSFKFKHDTNYTFTLGYQNTSAAWFGSNTSLVTVNASAQVQIDSTTKGFLPPRTNLTSNISTPAQGLMTYLTGSTNEGLYYYNSGSYQAWTKLLNNSGSQNITGSLSVSGSITQNGVSLQALSIAYAIALG